MKRKLIAALTILTMILCSASYVLATDDKSIDKNDLQANDPQAIEEQIAQEKDFYLWQIDALIDSGYTYDEISKMTIEEVDKILTKDLNEEELARYNAAKEPGVKAIAATAPAGYTRVAIVPDGGGTDEYFHPSVNTTDSTIAGIVADAKLGCKKIFDTTYNYPSITYANYLSGEWGEDPGRENWCHEGIDIAHKVYTTAAAYSPRGNGVVTLSSTSGKYVNIWFPSLGVTMNFQHLNDIDGTGALLEGEPVDLMQFLGRQNTTDAHVHVQTCTHYKCTQVHSGRELNYECVKPYAYIK
ncbi:hypothetical protein DesLBE_4831 [Desulfitobacterium sp. LBE]|uniref:Peptidase M23 domain-containing protein n=3 Tax=root TaxID=1 RepID=Q24U53_DESHY|nr:MULTISPECIES: hypothetical protein [Desulfitobacterium]KTE90161.1 hypothetical protein AT727_09545 [Desulfitobacterium hafniense]MEA5022448.1 hypothetical protein [Desulfitobacterium hafniense]TWH60396.1 hypothetical protein DesLBE_4831 [Desulfitobacterium sp. LBE]CDX02747.1 Hypothetical protein DPCES_2860 [Desulfitobacterium hafniense]BAE84439.1 hypothetical protein DSY2650 [Desulfitobacterium hafniense Y51]